MHPCQYFTHLWHFAFGLVLGHFNKMLSQILTICYFNGFSGFLGHPACTGYTVLCDMCCKSTLPEPTLFVGGGGGGGFKVNSCFN
jgi:hypothetical protein